MAAFKRLISLRKLGAVDGNNLETAPVFSILQELEEWDKQLKGLPEVTNKLRQFEAAARGVSEGLCEDEPTSPVEARRTGPRRSGPSP